MKFILHFCCAIIISGIFLAFGCGKEGPPLPPLSKSIELPVPYNLSVFADKTGNTVLKWEYPELFSDKRQKVQEFEIFAAIVSPDECKECPKIFVKIGTTIMPDMRFIIKSKESMDYYIKVRAVGFDTNIVSKYSNTIRLP